MSWEEALVARLLGDAAVAALVDDRVEWDDLAPDSALPAIMLQLINDGRTQTNDGIDAFTGDRVQVNCIARTKSVASALSTAAIGVIVPAGEQDGVTFLESFIDGGGSDAERTPTGRRNRKRTDLIIWHN